MPSLGLRPNLQADRQQPARISVYKMETPRRKRLWMRILVRLHIRKKPGAEFITTVDLSPKSATLEEAKQPEPETEPRPQEVDESNLAIPITVPKPCTSPTTAIALPNQRIFLFDLPVDILWLICQHLALKPDPIGGPDSNGEVMPQCFMTDYRQYRSLNFCLVSKAADALLSHVFFSHNTFEFHHARDFERFILSLSDAQRDRILRLRYYSSTSRPYSHDYAVDAATNPDPDSTADNTHTARHFPALSADELAQAATSFQNALVMTKTCNRLQKLEIYYRYQIHSENLNRPHSTGWEGAWTRHRLLASTPKCECKVAVWDYVQRGALVCLRGDSDPKQEDCSFDFEDPIPNELARRIDDFIVDHEDEVDVETYQIEPDCNEIVSDVVAARDRAVVTAWMDDARPVVWVVKRIRCHCCGTTIRWRTFKPDDEEVKNTFGPRCTGCQEFGDQIYTNDGQVVSRGTGEQDDEIDDQLRQMFALYDQFTATIVQDSDKVAY